MCGPLGRRIEIQREYMPKRISIADPVEARRTHQHMHIKCRQIAAKKESEHKCTAFDLYRALGGNEAWRRTWMRRITLVFLGEALRQTAKNLRQDGTLWRLSTWRSGCHFLFGKRGMLRTGFRPWRDYLRADFHPGQENSGLSQAWLQHNATRFTVVGAG